MSDTQTASTPESDDPLYTDLRLSMGANNGQHVVLLLDCGVGVNSRDRHGRTPLMWAAVGGNVRFLRLLVERGADLDAVCLNGRTALMRAACYGHTEAVRFLIESGADLNIRATNGWTALSGIRHAAHPAGAIAELRKAGAVE